MNHGDTEITAMVAPTVDSELLREEFRAGHDAATETPNPRNYGPSPLTIFVAHQAWCRGYLAGLAARNALLAMQLSTKRPISG